MNQEEYENEVQILKLEREECFQWIDHIYRELGRTSSSSSTSNADMLLLRDLSIPKALGNNNNNNNDGSSSEENGPWIIRSLVSKDIEILKQAHCDSNDWTRVYLLLPRAMASLPSHDDDDDHDNDDSICKVLPQYISHNCFSGMVVLKWPILSSGNIMISPDDHHHQHDNKLSSSSSLFRLGGGLHYNNHICDCIISLDAHVQHNDILIHTAIGSRAIIRNVSQIVSRCAGIVGMVFLSMIFGVWIFFAVMIEDLHTVYTNRVSALNFLHTPPNQRCLSCCQAK